MSVLFKFVQNDREVSIVLNRNMNPINVLICGLAFIVTGCASGLNHDSAPEKELPIGPSDVRLSWKPPKTYVDGRPLNKLMGYKIHYGTKPGDHPNSILVTDPHATQYVIKNLPSDTYYFVITAYDSYGIESAPSNEITKVVE